VCVTPPKIKPLAIVPEAPDEPLLVFIFDSTVQEEPFHSSTFVVKLGAAPDGGLYPEIAYAAVDVPIPVIATLAVFKS
jgi:hypothetical protein